MHLDVVGDDEFQPGQPHPITGQGGQFEGLFRVADVEHDPGAAGRQGADRPLFQPVGQGAAVDASLIALGAAGGDRLPIGDAAGGIAGAHDGGDTHLPGDDRRMASAAPLVGDHAAGALENRFPVWVGALGHQQIADAELFNLRGIGQDFGPAAADRRAHRPASAEQLGIARFQMPAAQQVAVAARFHRFRPGLEDEQLTADAVLCPLDIHGHRAAPPAGVMALDGAAPAGQLQHLRIADGEAFPLRGGHCHGFGGALGAGLAWDWAPGPGFCQFAEHRLTENRLAENRLAENRLVEIRLAENRLAQNRLAEIRVPGSRFAD